MPSVSPKVPSAVLTALEEPLIVRLVVPPPVTTADPAVAVSSPWASATVTVKVSPAVLPLSVSAPPEPMPPGQHRSSPPLVP